MSQPIRRVLSLVAVTRGQVAAIHLDLLLPACSSGLPGSSGGPPSNAPCLALLPVGFTKPPSSPRALVVSYTTVSPLPDGIVRRSVFCGTVPRVTPGGRYPPLCPVEPGRSSAPDHRRRDRLADSSAAASLPRPRSRQRPATAIAVAGAAKAAWAPPQPAGHIPGPGDNPRSSQSTRGRSRSGQKTQ